MQDVKVPAFKLVSEVQIEINGNAAQAAASNYDNTAVDQNRVTRISTELQCLGKFDCTATPLQFEKDD